MRGIGREINGGESAREQHLRVVLQRLLLALQPRTETEQQAAAETHEEQFSASTKFGDEILVGVVSKNTSAVSNITTPMRTSQTLPSFISNEDSFTGTDA